MDCTIYNPNKNKSSSSSTPILIPSSYSKRAATTPINGKNNKSIKSMRLSSDPQSVAARERRHRISDRFKILQSLVPGTSKLDTVSMLDQAIHYVKFLKAQILLHQAIINNKEDHRNLLNNTMLTPINNNDAYYYDQSYYALLYNSNVCQQDCGGASGCCGRRDGGLSLSNSDDQQVDVAVPKAEPWFCQTNDHPSVHFIL